MASLYGHKWVSSYGDEVDPDNVWAVALYGLSETTIRHGMRQCVDQGLEWPPSAPEFRKLCTGGSDVDWEHKRIEAAQREQIERDARLRLVDQGAKDAARLAGAAALADMRRALGIRKQPAGDAA